ncbi:EAL domain-containing protein [Marinobacter sp. MDS2]|uniref:EAL domain-containing protein n=1 Tax=Marinobacter sp. MDS2 TaxID=3065961 RepID=UPI00273C04B2|nr:EAL domain-containing protein [Marinobacter sp. MDS2]MDP4547807.1 EAL domain-containing protein [Marinobacter sp. MDS2]
MKSISSGVFSRSRSALKAMLAAFLAGVVFVLLLWQGILERPEAGLRDRIISHLVKEQPSNLLILEIDSASIEAIGQWPWPRSVHARAINQLENAGIRSLMIDVDFSSPSSIGGDRELEQAIQSISKDIPTYLPVFVQRRSQAESALMIRRPITALADSVELVSVNMHPSSDGLVRYLSVGFRWPDEFYRGAWSALAEQSDSGTWVDYTISPQSFRYVRFIDLLQGRVPDEVLRGRDVLIGATAIELGDTLATPIHQVLPGVVIQALGAQTLRNGGLYSPSPLVGFVILALVLFVAAVVFSRCHWRQGLLMLGVAIGVWSGVFVWAYLEAQLLLDVFKPILLSALVYVAVNLARLDAVTLERLWLQISLSDNEALLNRIVATTNDYILCVDRSGRITKANQAIQTLCELSESDMEGASLEAIMPDARHGVMELPDEPFDTYLVTQGGHHIPAQATVSRVATSGDAIFTVVLRDLRERVERERELEYRASYDALTGLLNRSAFFDRVNETLQNHSAGCLVCLDIDYFRDVNDTYGHAAGDTLLAAIAGRITQFVGTLGCCARIGGDGFALWLPGLRYSAGGSEFCGSLLEHLERPLALAGVDGPSVEVSATVGAADYQGKKSTADKAANECSATPAEIMLRQAADAMRLGKQEGVAVRCYNQNDQQAALRRLELVPAIRTHIQNNAFNLVYQPKLELNTLTPVGCEALLRWPDSANEYISVAQLIEVAENSRQIVPLTRWVVETLLSQESEWERLGRPRHLALNLSPRLFQDRVFFDGLKDLLRSSSGYFDIECEITETALLDNEGLAREMVSELIDSGASIAIDDFGTGYSSLAYLQSLRASVLKIDKSFVSYIQEFPNNQVIVRSTINMAHDLGMTVVAEGVETADDERFLHASGCDLVQGYLYGKPMALADFDRWLADRKQARTRPMISS